MNSSAKRATTRLAKHLIKSRACSRSRIRAGRRFRNLAAKNSEAEQAGESATGLPDLGPGADSSATLCVDCASAADDYENNCDFSFAGLKTAVLYLLKKTPNVSDDEKKHIAYEFENAVTDVLWHKTARALEETGARTLVIGGGVSANTHIQRVLQKKNQHEYPGVALCIPEFALSTDNAIMIALAGYYRTLRKDFVTRTKLKRMEISRSHKRPSIAIFLSNA